MKLTEIAAYRVVERGLDYSDIHIYKDEEEINIC